MSEKVISPDLGFINEVISSGGESLKKCFQCATCSVVCNVTPEDSPFPRKEMVQAQWGLKDELFRNPDIWLCHQCSDCTAHCPRGAKPGEVLGAIRKMSIARHSKPAFLAKMVGDPKWLVPLIAVPVVLFLLIMSNLGNIPFSNIPLVEGKISFRSMVPLMPYIDGTFVGAMTFAMIVLLMGIMSYWKDMSRGARPQGNVVHALIDTLWEILEHRKFSQCDVQSGRRLAHMMVFFGFVGLAITTGLSATYEWVLHRYTVDEGFAAVPLSDPLKFIGNASAILLLVGVVFVILNRMSTAAKAGGGSYYDWLFICLVVTLGASGFAAQVARLAEMANLAYSMYFIHLVSIFFLFFYAPYSKMAHMVYRTTAIVFAKMTGRAG